MKKILIIEDNLEIVEILNSTLKKAGYMTTVKSNGNEALKLLKTNAYDLIILDIVIPEVNGFEICQKVRRTDTLTKIIMLTSMSNTSDIVRGLNVGANDYVTKPFELEELLARVRNLLGENNILKYGKFVINTRTRTLTNRTKMVTFCQKEFEVLMYMIRNKGNVISRAEILDNIWRSQRLPYPNNVDVQIRRLRRKLNSNLIQTVHGVGYKIDL